MAEAYRDEAGRTWAEHLAWAKERALEYGKQGAVLEAWNSLASDLRKHPGTADHVGTKLGAMQLLGGSLNDPTEMRRYIEGFN